MYISIFFAIKFQPRDVPYQAANQIIIKGFLDYKKLQK